LLFLVVVLPLILIEVTLQVAAFVTWYLGRQREERSLVAGETTILCVGDSFTFGLGASHPAHSYPAQLEQYLRDSGVRTVNRGWPGQSSLEVMRALGPQLRELRPAIVCVLVGYNDRWAQPLPHRMADFESETATSTSFSLRWRTGRLLAILLDRLASRSSAADPDDASPASSPPSPGVVGEWSDGRLRLHFRAGGELLAWMQPTQSKAAQLRWSEVAPGSIEVEVAKGRRQQMRWYRDATRLALAPADGSGTRILLTATDRVARGASEHPPPRPAGGQDLESERRQLEQLLSKQPNDLNARVDLIRVLTKCERPDQAIAQLEWLEQFQQRGPSQAAAEAVMNGAWASGNSERALALAQDVSRHYPNSVQACVVATQLQWLRSAWPEVLANAERGLVIPTTDKHAHAFLLRMRGTARTVLRPDNGGEVIQGIFAAYLEDGDDGLALRHLQRLNRDQVKRVAEALDPAAPGYETIKRLVDRLVDRDGSAATDPVALDLHLHEIVAACRRSGAQPILLSYPESIPGVDAVLERVASDTGSLWVDLRPTFRELLASRPHSDLFIGDGHCADGGYAVMAQRIAQAIQTQMPRRTGPSPEPGRH
jgi:lysophospholipase L1-like esterase